MADALQALEQGLSVAAQKGDVQAARAITAEMQRLMKEANPGVDQVDLAAEGARMAAQGTGSGEAALIGAGRTADKTVAGVKQAFMGLPQYPMLEASNEKAKADLAAEQAQKDQAYGALRKEHPVATAGGEAAPYVSVPVSMGPLGAGATVGAIEASQYGTPRQRMARGFMGAGTTAVGGFMGNAVARAVAPVTGKAATETGQAALDAAERIGMRPTLGQATGSTFIRRLEDVVARLPGGGAVMAEHAAGDAAALNRAAARSIGEAADELTPEVFSRAATRIGKVFDDLEALPGRPIQLGPQVESAADKILATQAKMLPHQQDANLIKIARDAKALAANKGRIDGQTYKLQRSGLSDAAFDATVGTNKQLYGDLLKALDDAAESSLGAAGQAQLAADLKIARPQWANLKTLEKGLTVEGGDVVPARVASTMRTNNPGAFRRGKFIGTELGDVAAVGENLPKLRQGSQTFERDALANPLTAAFHWLWSTPTAKVLTSPAATLYPRTLGNTEAARVAAQVANPSTRAAVAAALQQSGLLPVAAE